MAGYNVRFPQFNQELITGLADAYIKGSEFKRGREEEEKKKKDEADLKALSMRSPDGIPTSRDLSRYYFSRGDAKTGTLLDKAAKEEEYLEEDRRIAEQERTHKQALGAAKGVLDAFQKAGTKENFKKIFPMLQQAYPENLKNIDPDDFYFDSKRDVMAIAIPGQDGKPSPGWMIYDRNAGPEGAIHVVKNDEVKNAIEKKKADNTHLRLIIEAEKAHAAKIKARIGREKKRAKDELDLAQIKAIGSATDKAFVGGGIDIKNMNPEQKLSYETVKKESKKLVEKGVSPSISVQHEIFVVLDPKLKAALKVETDKDVKYIEDHYEFMQFGDDIIITGRKDVAPASPGSQEKPARRFSFDSATGKIK